MSVVIMTRISLPDKAHATVAAVLRPGMTAIDATLGNGHDALFLARQTGPSGIVFGFDIQAQAIQNTRSRLQQYGLEQSVRLLQVCHSEMLKHIPTPFQGRIQAIMFNLGYLPGGDKTLITSVNTSLAALGDACRLLSVGGIITVIAYPGHAGGQEETEAITCYCLSGLDSAGFAVEIIHSQHRQAHAPQLLIIRKQQSKPILVSA